MKTLSSLCFIFLVTCTGIEEGAVVTTTTLEPGAIGIGNSTDQSSDIVYVNGFPGPTGPMGPQGLPGVDGLAKPHLFLKCVWNVNAIFADYQCESGAPVRYQIVLNNDGTIFSLYQDSLSKIEIDYFLSQNEFPTNFPINLTDMTLVIVGCAWTGIEYVNRIRCEPAICQFQGCQNNKCFFTGKVIFPIELVSPGCITRFFE